MGMINPVDAKLSFGSGTYSTACENVLSLNKAQTERMKVEVIVTTAMAAGTNDTFTFKVQGSDDGSSFSDIAVTDAIAKSTLTAGANVSIPIPDGVNKKFLKVTSSCSGTATAGAYKAYLDTYLGI